MAEFLAGHALLLLALGILLAMAAVALVAALAVVAARHRDRLWSWIDAIVPGHLWRPRTYLAVHLTLGLILVTAAAAFFVIAEDVIAGRRLAAFDLAFAEALRDATSPAWHSAFWYLTWLGSAFVLAPVGVLVVWVLVKRRQPLFAIGWSIALGGAALLNYAMKLAFARTRPEGADPLLYGGGWAFPSGHAMVTLVACGMAAYLLLRLSRTRRPAALLALTALLLAWALVIGFSRLYLGVHYVSDVVAGFLAGTAWIAVCVSGTEVALRRRSTEG